MKLSLSWIFDHIQADWHTLDINAVMNHFNRSVAEMEGYTSISLNKNALTLGIVSTVDTTVTVSLPEHNRIVTLPLRDDASQGTIFFVWTENQAIRWATANNLGSTRDGLIGPVHATEKECMGSWREQCIADDILIEIDNKSINHRPDMWGHRGVAREIAALINAPMVPLNTLITDIPTIESDIQWNISIQNPRVCSRFNALYVPQVTNRASDVFITQRLLSIDSKPINALVDLTNYVMFDIGHPMHVFDADTLPEKTLNIRAAYQDEQVTVLDGEAVTLKEVDTVVASGDTPVAVAGIIGGLSTGVHDTTTSILIEAACFDPATIRKTAGRIRKRTEASARFEKSMSQKQALIAIERYYMLMYNAGLVHEAPSHPILSAGTDTNKKFITLDHVYIERMLAMRLTPQQICAALEPLEFTVNIVGTTEKPAYEVEVPFFRATKDINGPHDIVEEIGRRIGFDNANQCVPSKQMSPTPIHPVLHVRHIKQHLAFSAHMHEVYNYPFYDAEWLTQMQWSPTQALELSNPVATTRRLLVTSLIPHLLQAIVVNNVGATHLRFFEWNAIWHQGIDGSTIEKKSLAGIIFDHKIVDFYDAQSILSGFFDALRMPILWKKPHNTDMIAPWFDIHRTADIFTGNTYIGRAGIVPTTWLQNITHGQAFVFELDAHLLQAYQAPTPYFKPLNKYQQSSLDMSMMIPRSITVADITACIKSADSRIRQVELVDQFERPEWGDQKSLTMRFYVYDTSKTLSKEDIDAVNSHVIKAIATRGAQVR